MAGLASAVETVHVVDDDAGVRDSLRVLLGAAGFAVQSHANAEEFLASATATTNGCALIDVCMPGIDGLELQRRMNSAGISLPIIVMTGHGDIPLAVRAMKAGAIDVLEKPFDDVRLLDAVRRALQESRRRQEIESAAANAAGRLAMLTPREREVFDLLVAGQSTKAIASELSASPRTIEVHRARVFEKLEVSGLPELLRLMLDAAPVGVRRI